MSFKTKTPAPCYRVNLNSSAIKLDGPGAPRCFDCTRQIHHSLLDYQDTDSRHSHSQIPFVECPCCEANTRKISSKNRFTLNVNFTSTPKINKFRPSVETAKAVLPSSQSWLECQDCALCKEAAMTRRGAKPASLLLDETLVRESSSNRKPSFALLSINDYVRKLLQKKGQGKSSLSVQTLTKRVTVAKGGLDLVVSRKQSLHEHRLKRRLGRRSGRCTNVRPKASLVSHNLPAKSSHIDAQRFCDLKFNESSNYPLTAPTNGFNQLGQLKVWYV